MSHCPDKLPRWRSSFRFLNYRSCLLPFFKMYLHFLLIYRFLNLWISENAKNTWRDCGFFFNSPNMVTLIKYSKYSFFSVKKTILVRYRYQASSSVITALEDILALYPLQHYRRSKVATDWSVVLCFIMKLRTWFRVESSVVVNTYVVLYPRFSLAYGYDPSYSPRLVFL